jgi:hypothetical protein
MSVRNFAIEHMWLQGCGGDITDNLSWIDVLVGYGPDVSSSMRARCTRCARARRLRRSEAHAGARRRSCAQEGARRDALVERAFSPCT